MEEQHIQDLAIQFSSEGLDAENQLIYDAWVITATDEEKATFTEMVDISADMSIAGVSLSEVELSPMLHDKLISTVESNSPEEGVKLVRKDDQDWINLPIKGAKWLELSARKKDGFVMSMIEVSPGTGFPEHDHHGVEMAYILEGDLEADGVTLQAGDFFRADAGTHHGNHFSPSGCRALIVTSNDNYKHKTMKTFSAVQKGYRKIKSVFASK